MMSLPSADLQIFNPGQINCLFDTKVIVKS
jgi:hypothetical protein